MKYYLPLCLALFSCDADFAPPKPKKFLDSWVIVSAEVTSKGKEQAIETRSITKRL
jgi:hypothetical protein